MQPASLAFLGAAHATCCALGEATRGHNAATTLVHASAQSCDHSNEVEVPGLVPGTDLRPADVLTSAFGSACTVLDISICSPHAQRAGPDRAFMVYDYFRVTGAHDTVLDYADSFSVTLHDDDILEFDKRWDEVRSSMSKIPSDDILESLYKL